jgi:hypothetical protein
LFRTTDLAFVTGHPPKLVRGAFPFGTRNAPDKEGPARRTVIYLPRGPSNPPHAVCEAPFEPRDHLKERLDERSRRNGRPQARGTSSAHIWSGGVPTGLPLLPGAGNRLMSGTGLPGQRPHVSPGQNSGTLFADIAVGDEIQAWHNGKIYFQGTALSLIPSLDLITIECGRTGAARLVDASVLRVTKAIPLLEVGNINAGPARDDGRAAKSPNKNSGQQCPPSESLKAVCSATADGADQRPILTPRQQRLFSPR